MDIQGTRPAPPVARVQNGSTEPAPAKGALPAAPVAAKPVVPMAVPLPGATQPAPAAAEGAAQQAAKARAEAIARQLQDYMRSTERELEFSIDEDTGVPVVAVRDGVTGELIRQMPSDEALRILRYLDVGQPTVLDQTV